MKGDTDAAISHYQSAIMLNPKPDWTSIVAQTLGYIEQNVIKNVDCAIVTHCHEDHFGGFIYLLEENIKIDKFYINIPSECVPMPKIKQKVDAVYSTDGKNLVDLIVAKEKESKTSHSSCFTYAPIPLIDDDCPNLKVLSPTKAYYTDLVNKFIKKAKLEEYQASESAYPIYSQALEKSDEIFGGRCFLAESSSSRK